MFRIITLATALIAGGLIQTAVAATVDIGFASYSKSDAASALLQRDRFIGSGRVLAEDFEQGFLPCTNDNHRDCSAGDIMSSQVGSFTGFGQRVQDGASQVRPKSKVVVRTGETGGYGRYNVTPGGANWLDSNDREGIAWSFDAPKGVTFRRVAFFLTDLDDVGNVVFSLIADRGPAVALPSTEPGGNGRLHLITMLFDQPVSTFSVRMVNGAGDGFGLDGARIAAIPLPAAGLLSIGALAGLVLLARRRRVA